MQHTPLTTNHTAAFFAGAGDALRTCGARVALCARGAGDALRARGAGVARSAGNALRAC